MTVHLLHGSDAMLLADQVRALIHQLAGDADVSLAVEELAGEEYEVGAVADAAQTPPFLTDTRVVVARGLSRFNVDELAPLLRYLADPLPTTELVLEWPGGRVPKALADAVAKAGGANEDVAAPTGRGRPEWIGKLATESGISLDADGRALLAGWLGEDAGRLPAVLDTLVAVHGAGARLGPEDIEPFLGEAGSVPPWELTDAIDRGDTAGALARLHRMLGGGERHALQVMGTLVAHYTRILRLDGAEARDEKAAAELLGLRGSTFPAKKALSQARRLGHDGVVRAMTLLADADLDLRGNRAWPDELVLEVLVARLSRLAPRQRESGSGRGRSSASSR